MTVLRPFRWPAPWVAMWLAMVGAVIALSLVPAPPIPDALVTGKLDHLLAYFALATFAVQLTARAGIQLAAGCLLAMLGIGLEFAQGYLTETRDMSLYDGVIDIVGVLAGLVTAQTPLARLLERLDALLPVR